MTCSETIKACGFKNVEKFAELNGLTSETVRKYFREDIEKFKACVYLALDESETERRERAELILGAL